MDKPTGQQERRQSLGRMTYLVPLRAVAVLDVALIASLALVDRVAMISQGQLHHVSLGLPLPWVHQDQSVISPPLPTHTGLLSPWESPTAIAWLPLTADLLIVAAVLGGACVLLRLLQQRRTSAHRSLGTDISDDQQHDGVGLERRGQ